MYTIKKATLHDIDSIEIILLDAVLWLKEKNIQNLWNENNTRWDILKKTYDISDFYIIFVDNEAAGCMALTDVDEKYWPDYQKGEAIFLHKMAVKRKFAGMNVSVVLMDYVKEYAAKLGVKAVCLDCNSKRNRLRTLYEENGFKYVKDMKNEEYILALYCYYVQ